MPCSVSAVINKREDEYRKPGLSKERRLEPQIVVGLLVDERGFPLQLHSFEGNKAETLTLAPVPDAFRAQHPEVAVSVACDAGMLSAANLLALEDAGYSFIVGSRIAKTPPDVAEYQHNGSELKDRQIFESRQWFGRGETRRERRLVYQYREKRARLDLRNIQKQVEKAEKARQRAGIKGYVTNLPILTAPALTVIDAYQQLFNVEASFRMAKTDLKARPIYHRQREKIEAHLTVVFCAIAISRHIQEATCVSVKKFVQQLARVQDGVVKVEGVEHVVPAAIPGEMCELLTQLSGSGAGH